MHRASQQAEQVMLGERYHDSGYVITSLNGDPLAPDRLSRYFRQLSAAAGLPPIRLHDLRPGAASLALAAGADLKVVQDMLGHSSIVLTADTYTSVLPEVARRAAEHTAAPDGAPCGDRRAPWSRAGSASLTRPGKSPVHATSAVSASCQGRLSRARRLEPIQP